MLRFVTTTTLVTNVRLVMTHGISMTTVTIVTTVRLRHYRDCDNCITVAIVTIETTVTIMIIVMTAMIIYDFLLLLFEDF